VHYIINEKHFVRMRSQINLNIKMIKRVQGIHMKMIACASVLFLMVGMPFLTYAEEGLIVKVFNDNFETTTYCQKFVISTRQGFTIAGLLGGCFFFPGDSVSGDLNSFGPIDLRNETWHLDARVWIEAIWLDKKEAIRKLYK